MEVSAKDNTNIEELFFDIIKSLSEKHLKSIANNINFSPSTNNVVFKNDKVLNKKKKCC